MILKDPFYTFIINRNKGDKMTENHLASNIDDILAVVHQVREKPNKYQKDHLITALAKNKGLDLAEIAMCRDLLSQFPAHKTMVITDEDKKALAERLIEDKCYNNRDFYKKCDQDGLLSAQSKINIEKRIAQESPISLESKSSKHDTKKHQNKIINEFAQEIKKKSKDTNSAPAPQKHLIDLTKWNAINKEKKQNIPLSTPRSKQGVKK